MIAAWLDGLLDPAAAWTVAALVERDEAWAAELARQRRVRELLAALPAPDAAAAGERVWLRLQAAAGTPQRVSLWRRQVSVPVPAAAGAVAAVLLLAFALVFTAARGPMGTMRITTVPSGLKQVQIEAPLADLEQLLRSLESGTPGREVIISLPETSHMFVIGEPVLMRAAEAGRSRFR